MHAVGHWQHMHVQLEGARLVRPFLVFVFRVVVGNFGSELIKSSIIINKSFIINQLINQHQSINDV